ncbi:MULTISPECIES: ABC transporter permease [unclassified Devosia]|uniref:ABC transporter permease n=1 Tax=unclassified Devosia TaxID=196773 RepID=UPI00145DD344|nr:MULTISPECIES: ABC transporter permease [unclassified Devosia]MBJ6988033.1 ABC transporter permease [Devosia sp. MC521]MBJ7578442.1 ABC transporter permease [Devosia sp. MC532]MBK1794767.1 ABC transporter permease [Devosia sp. WQ 349K1]QMW62104.1 ABC transporter permease [Devosia sp. MC521]
MKFFTKLTQNWSWLGFAYAAFAFYLLSPLMIVVMMSFKDGVFLGFPIEKWTTRWFLEVAQDREFHSALGLSLYIAVISTLIALIVGVWVAVLLARAKLWGRPIIFALACMPLVVPSIVSAISLRIFAQSVGIPPGTTAIIMAHAIHSVPYMTLMALTRLNGMPKNITEAARDLGADSFVTFVRVTLPYLMPALIGGTVFSMLSSFDDFVRSFFLGGYNPTLPVLIYGRIFSGLTPSLAAMSTMILVVTICIGLYTERMVRRRMNNG